MKKPVWFAVLVSLVILGVLLWFGRDRQRVATRGELDIRCRVVIPPDLKEAETFHEKDGEEIILNARELYAGAFESGWNDYLERFQAGEIDLDEESAQPDLMQEWGLTMDARHQGFWQCRQDILHYAKAHRLVFRPVKDPFVKQLLNAGARLDHQDDDRLEAREPVGITLRGEEITDRDLQPIRHFTLATEVDVAGTGITDKGLECLGTLADLRNLDVSGTRITDAGLERVAGFPKLVLLDLSNTAVTDVGVSLLASLPELEVLDLRGVSITDQALVALSRAPKLRCLYLGRAADDSVSIDFSYNPSQQSVEAEITPNHPRTDIQAPAITDVGLVAIGRMSKLEALDLEGAGITDEGLKALQALDHLDYLKLNHTAITDRGLSALSSLGGMGWLMVEGTRITDDGLKAISGWNKLQTLSVCDCDVTDEGLRHLEGCKSLNTIWRKGTRITDAGIERLRQVIPGLRD